MKLSEQNARNRSAEVPEVHGTAGMEEAPEVHGTVELRTENLILRRYCPEDAEQLYKYFGKDPEMYRYSGWNPYATPEMTLETICRFIGSYSDEHSYSWVMDAYGVDAGVGAAAGVGADSAAVDIVGAVVGTIGAYDYKQNQIEVGISVARRWQGRGFATEALKKVLEYLTENEGISCVTAWCAAENTGSRKAMEKAGMRLVRTEKSGLSVGEKIYDKLIYEYKGRPPA